MMVLCAAALAAVLAAAPAPAPAEGRKAASRHSQAAAPKPLRSQLAQRALRRRVLHLARITMFERREALLSEFLIESQTETPLYNDSRRYDAGNGIEVSQVIVSRDFIGSPLIRARVRNLTEAETSVLLSASIEARDGRRAEAVTLVERIPAGGTRLVTIVSPQAAVPLELTWSALPLR